MRSRRAAFQRIRFLRSSSAPLAPSLHREFLDKFNLLLIQAMGSSEAGNIFSNPLPPARTRSDRQACLGGSRPRSSIARASKYRRGSPGKCSFAVRP